MFYFLKGFQPQNFFILSLISMKHFYLITAKITPNVIYSLLFLELMEYFNTILEEYHALLPDSQSEKDDCTVNLVFSLT